MSMTREEFNRAFTEVVSMEFADIPTKESEIDFTFSKNFLRKMDNLIALQQDGVWKLLGVVRRHIAVIAIIILGVTISACGINQVVIHLYGNVYEEMREEFYAGVTATEIAYEFKISDLPEGFEKVGLIKDTRHIISEYENEDGDEIIFLQDATAEARLGIKDELTEAGEGRKYVTRSSTMIRDIKVELYENKDYAGAIWIEDGYYMELRYYGCESLEEITAMIDSVVEGGALDEKDANVH